MEGPRYRFPVHVAPCYVVCVVVWGFPWSGVPPLVLYLSMLFAAFKAAVPGDGILSEMEQAYADRLARLWPDFTSRLRNKSTDMRKVWCGVVWCGVVWCGVCVCT
jgi:hypothetical protein